MKRIYLLAIILLILIATLAVNLYFLGNKVVAPGLSVNQQDNSNAKSGLISPKDSKELYSCAIDSDCTIVEGKACCSCFEVVNKKYVDYWNVLEKEICPENLACTVCPNYLGDVNLKAVCINNKCNYN